MKSNFQIQDLPLEGVKLITPFYMEDNRGYFLKSMERDVYKEWGLEADIYEEFETYSKKGVVRGLHFQTKDPQVKIVRTISGVVHNVVVDLRKGSSTFGRCLDIILDNKDNHSLWIPEGFAHGFEVLSEDAIMSYKCIGKYLKGYDTGIRWDDKDLAIKWETREPIISQKDAGLMGFREFTQRYSGL